MYSRNYVITKQNWFSVFLSVWPIFESLTFPFEIVHQFCSSSNFHNICRTSSKKSELLSQSNPRSSNLNITQPWPNCFIRNQRVHRATAVDGQAAASSTWSVQSSAIDLRNWFWSTWWFQPLNPFDSSCWHIVEWTFPLFVYFSIIRMITLGHYYLNYPFIKWF
jgi:hypothetical protein